MPSTTEKPGDSLPAADTTGTPFASTTQWHEFGIWSDSDLMGIALLTDAEAADLTQTMRIVTTEENRPVTWLEYLRTITEQ